MEGREVLVWLVDLDLPGATTATLYARLSDDERDRCARFRFERDQRRFIASHGALRDLLGQYLGIHATEVRFATNAFGKPALTPDLGAELSFNLAHSADLAVIAVAKGADVGVDVECLKAEVECLDVAQHWFSAAESVALKRLAGSNRTESFLTLWTRKEAWAKASGEGLSMPERVFASGPKGDWSLFAIRPAPSYLGAVAIKGGGWRLREGYWDAEVSSGNTLVI